MITAQEARIALLKNPTFERKTELYKEVSDIIEKAVSERKSSFNISEEQHLALKEELVIKGYKPQRGFVSSVSVAIIADEKATTSTHFTYNF